MQNTKQAKVGRPRKYEDAVLDRKFTLRLSTAEYSALTAHGLKAKMKVSDLVRSRCSDILTV